MRKQRMSRQANNIALLSPSEQTKQTLKPKSTRQIQQRSTNQSKASKQLRKQSMSSLANIRLVKSTNELTALS